MKPALPILSLLIVLVAVPVAATPTLRDFELPPGPTPTPTASPQVQGPVDPDAPVATRPRPVESPAPAPTGQPTPAPRVELPRAEPTAPVARPAPTASAGPGPAATLAPPGTAPDSSPAVPGAALPREAVIPPPAAPSLPAGEPAQVPESGSWAWIAGIGAGLAGLVAVLAGGLLWWRRRSPAAGQAPRIELPLVTPAGEPAPAPARAPSSAPAAGPTAAPVPASSALRIEATPTHLARSFMAATFACRISLANRGAEPLENVTVGIDLTTAHGSLPASEQLADPARTLPEAGRFARIAPGESVEFAHEVRLPTAEIRTLRQGEAHLYVPLLRVRAEAGGQAPVARTFIVGTLPDAEAKKLQPFRLDEMPQTYRMIGVAALD